MNLLKKIPWSTVYLVVTIVVVAIIAFSGDQLEIMMKAMSSLSFTGILMVILVQVGFILVEGAIICFLLRVMGEKIKFPSCLKVGVIGLYYCSITPSATGGQPAQVAYLKRDNNINVGNSVATLSLKFFTYQLGIVILGTISFFFMYNHLLEVNPALIPVIITGLFVNTFSVALFVPMLFSTKFLGVLCRFLRKLVNIIKFIKHKEKRIDSIDKFEADFSVYSKKYREKLSVVFCSILISIPELLLQMGVLYFVFASFGNTSASYLEITAMQFMLQAAVAFFPMPGAAGAQELAFTAFLAPYFGDSQIFAALIIWRFFTYYIIIIGGAGLIVVDELIQKRKRRAKLLEL